MNDIDGLPPTEASPLLNRRPNELAQSEIDQRSRSGRYRLSGAFGIVSLLTFSSFCSAMSGTLCVEPVGAMFEDAICTRHYAGREGDKDCKTAEVQFQVMWFQNALYTVGTITSIIVALPYGVLSDRIGRRPIFLFATMGTTLSLFWNVIMLQLYDRIPFHLVFLSPILQVLGGGLPTLSIMRLSIAADVVSPRKRATSLLYIAAATYLGGWAGFGFSNYMLRWGSVLMPVMVAFVLIPIGSATIIFIPETLRTEPNQDSQPSQAPNAQSSRHFSKSRFRSCIKLQGFKKPSISMVLVFSCLALATPKEVGMGPALQFYLHSRLGWPALDSYQFVTAMQMIATTLLYVLALPVILAILQSQSLRLRLSASRLDLILAQLSALVLMVGLFLTGSSIGALIVTGVGLVTMGSGFTWLCYSVLLSFTKQHASLFALAYIIETATRLLINPALTGLVMRITFEDTLQQGWLYFVLGAFFVVALVLLLLVRVPTTATEDGEDESETVVSGTRPSFASRIYRQISLVVARR